MKAPERIWANITTWGDFKPLCGEWNHCDVGSSDDTEFVRYDIHADLQAENERLREELDKADELIGAYVVLYGSPGRDREFPGLLSGASLI